MLGAGERPRAEPRSQAARLRHRGFDVKREAFLTTEEAATARLGGLFRQMRYEIEAFLKSGDASDSDTAFYAKLLSQVDTSLVKVSGMGKAWVAEWMPKGFVAGAELQAEALELLPIHDRALRFLSAYTLDLISDTTEGVRRTVQQEVGQAVAGSISRQALAERLEASGLTAGPWRNVETRAMVIARTEQMRAYNAGNIAGIRSNGAVAGEWITSRDERVCYICGPRHGKAFLLPGVTREEATAAGAPASWEPLGAVTARGTDTAPPAHPRCRCTLRARYRDDAGNILEPPTAEPVAPTAEVAAAGVEPTDLADFDAALADLLKPDPGMASGDAARKIQIGIAETMEKSAKRLEDERDALERAHGHEYGHPYFGGPFSQAYQEAGRTIRDLRDQARKARAIAASVPFAPDPAGVALWRRMDLTPERIDRIASIAGPDGDQAMDNLLRRRYGVAWAGAEYDAPTRAIVIKSLERYRALRPELVVDSPWMAGVGNVGFATDMGSNELGTYSGKGWLRLKGDEIVRDYGGKPLRVGPDVDGATEIVVHEMGHGVWQTVRDMAGEKNQWNIQTDDGGRYIYPPVATSSRWITAERAKEALATWQRIQDGTSRARIAPFATGSAAERELRDGLRVYRELKEGAIAKGRDGASAQVMIDKLEAQLADLQRATAEGVEHFPTTYAESGKIKDHEDFAETIAVYMLNPEKLRIYSPARYAFVRDYIFGGKEA
jgi:hypothetical protein